MTQTVIIRIPVKDYKEIDAISKKWGIRIGAAYQLWTRKNDIGFKWKEF